MNRTLSALFVLAGTCSSLAMVQRAAAGRPQGVALFLAAALYLVAAGIAPAASRTRPAP